MATLFSSKRTVCTRYADIYKSGMEYASSPDAATGWEKYLADEEAKNNAPKHDLNNNGKDEWWEKALGYLSNNGTGVIDTSIPGAEIYFC